jgi:antitoxin VapB
MALRIKDPETDRLVRELARLTGESMTEALRKAAAERLERERRKRGEVDDENLVAELHAIAVHCASLPVLDDRTPDEILDYDEHGLPR